MMVTDQNLKALQIGFKKNFQDAFTATRSNSDFLKIATLIASTSGSEGYGWLGKFPKMREWVGPREVKNMETHDYSISSKDFEATVGVARNDIDDDNLGLYAPLFAEMGHSAAQQPDELAFGLLASGQTALCYDGQPFIDSDHRGFDSKGNEISVSNIEKVGDAPFWYLLDTTRPLKPLIYQERKPPEFVSKTDPNKSDHVFKSKEFLYGVDARCNVGFGFWQMAYGSNKPLNGANLDAAIEAMRSRYDENGRPLGIKPSLLVVGPENRAAAHSTVKAALSEGGKSNTNFEAVEVLDTDWLLSV